MKKIFLALMMTFSFSFAVVVCDISPTSNTYAGQADLQGKYIQKGDLVYKVSTFIGSASKTCSNLSTSTQLGFSGTYIYAINPYNSNYQYQWSSSLVSTCANGTVNIVTGVCVSNVPTCTANQYLQNNVCINKPTCAFGYHNDSTLPYACSPDKTCPASMKYFAQATGTFSFDIKTCLPNRDLTPADCASKGGTYLTQFDSDPNQDLAMVVGTGCVDASYIANEYHAFGRSFLVSGLLPSINTAYLAKFGNTLFSGGKSVYDAVKNFFKSDPVASQQGLLTYKPEFIDLQIQADGTYAVMDWKVRNQVWEDLTGGNANLKPYTVTTPDVTPPNVYLGGDIAVVENSLIGTKSFLDNPTPLVVPSTSPLNTVTTSTLDLKNSLYGTQTTPFNVTSTLVEKSTDTAGTLLTKTQSRINYPDGSSTNVTTLASRVASGETTYTITASTPIKTTSGEAVYNQVTTVTTNNVGAVTNTVNNAGSITTTNSSGHTFVTPNVANPALAPQTDTGTINLSNIQASLNQLNKTATETKTVLEDLVNHTPVNTPAFNTKIIEFSSGLADLSLSIDNGFNFVNGLKNSLSDLENQFNDAKTIFDNKPTITLQNGTCPFQSHWYGQTVTVDPCMFIAPYRSINAIFFTLIFSFAVLMFALKYLFDVRLGGK